MPDIQERAASENFLVQAGRHRGRMACLVRGVQQEATVTPRKSLMTDAIVEALKLACEEQRFDVAEHLLAGLETI